MLGADYRVRGCGASARVVLTARRRQLVSRDVVRAVRRCVCRVPMCCARVPSKRDAKSSVGWWSRALAVGGRPRHRFFRSVQHGAGNSNPPFQAFQALFWLFRFWKDTA